MSPSFLPSDSNASSVLISDNINNNNNNNNNNNLIFSAHCGRGFSPNDNSPKYQLNGIFCFPPLYLTPPYLFHSFYMSKCLDHNYHSKFLNHNFN
jgi:hypothetical protein